MFVQLGSSGGKRIDINSVYQVIFVHQIMTWICGFNISLTRFEIISLLSFNDPFIFIWFITQYKTAVYRVLIVGVRAAKIIMCSQKIVISEGHWIFKVHLNIFSSDLNYRSANVYTGLMMRNSVAGNGSAMCEIYSKIHEKTKAE